MKILIVGSGGREHALAWKLKQSPYAERIFCAPGNAGTAEIGENVAISTSDLASLVRFAKENRVDLTVVGPDDPLAAGIVDLFAAEGLRIFGPTKTAARIESSKIFAKKLMRMSKESRRRRPGRLNIATTRFDFATSSNSLLSSKLTGWR